MIKGVPHAHLAPIWYHSEPSNAPTQFLGWDSFYRFLQQTRSSTVFGSMKKSKSNLQVCTTAVTAPIEEKLYIQLLSLGCQRHMV